MDDKKIQEALERFKKAKENLLIATKDHADATKIVRSAYGEKELAQYALKRACEAIEADYEKILAGEL